MNTAFARSNMLKQQIRASHVLDARTLALLQQVPREAFVPKAYFPLAFADTFIPIGHGQSMLTPLLEARLLQALRIQPTEKVLEVGTGSGYGTALLGKAAQHVYSIDIFPEFVEHAQQRLQRYNITNCTLVVGNAAQGWDKHQPYDAIAVTGALPTLPAVFPHQLKIGGRLFVIVGESPVMEALLITRINDHQWHTERLFETEVAPLLEASIQDPFTLLG